MPIIAFLVTLVCFASLSAEKTSAASLEEIRSKGVLAAGVKADYPPFGFRDKDGQIAGLEPELAADLARRLGVNLRMVPVLSSNRFDLLRNGTVDLVIATLSVTSERRKEAAIIDPPYYAAGAGILAPHGIQIEEVTELGDRKLCVVEGNIFFLELQSQFPTVKVLVFKDVPSAERALLEGHCEGFFFNENLLSYKKRSEPERFAGYDVIQLGDFDPLLWAVAIGLGQEHSTLADFLSQSVIDWHRSGFLLNAEKKWVGENTQLLHALNVKWALAMPATPAEQAKPEFGTAAEARAMLERVVAAMKADKVKTLLQITRREKMFKDRDLYPYCIGPNGRYVAHPDHSRIGLVYTEVRDKAGKAYGREVSRFAAEGKFGEVHYVFPRPTDGVLRPKVGLFTKVSGHICVVGYYQ